MDVQNSPVVVTHEGSVYRVAVSGAIHTNVAWLEDELKRVAAASPTRVDLDLSATSYMSSTGIGTFAAFHRNVTAAGGEVHIVAMQKRVYGVFKFACLDKVFKIDAGAIVTPPAGA